MSVSPDAEAQKQAAIQQQIAQLEAQKAAAQKTLSMGIKAVSSYARPGKGARRQAAAARPLLQQQIYEIDRRIAALRGSDGTVTFPNTVQAAAQAEVAKSKIRSMDPTRGMNPAQAAQFFAAQSRGTIVSTDARTQEQFEQDRARAAGYTDTARLDPRSEIFSAPEGGLFDRNTRAAPSSRIVDAAQAAQRTAAAQQQRAAAEAVRAAETTPSYLDIGFDRSPEPRKVLDEITNAARNLGEQFAGFGTLPTAAAETPEQRTERLDIAQANLAQVDQIRETVRQAREAGAKEITITNEAGVSRTVPIGSAFREIVQATRDQSVTLSAEGVGRREITIQLQEDLNIGTGLGAGRPLGSTTEIVDLVNPPRQVTATDALIRAREKTGLGLSILAPITEFLDRELELGTPKELRSTANRRIPGVPKEVFSMISNREIGETFAPVANFGAEFYDFGRATAQRTLKRPVPFSEEALSTGNPFGLPVPAQKTPRQKTALDKAFEGKPIDFRDPATQASLAGEALPLLGIGAAIRGGQSVAEKAGRFIRGRQDVKQLAEILSPAKAPPVSQTRTFAPVESAVSPKTRTQEIVPSLLQNIIGKRQTTPSGIRIKRTGEGTFDIESTNPLAQGIVTARKVGKKEFVFEDLRADVSGKRPTGIDVFGSVGKAEQQKFGLIPTSTPGKFVTKGAGKPDLAEQLASDIVTPVARQRTFTSQQIRKGGPEMGAFLFGPTRPGFLPPTAPLSDIIMFETRASRLIPTRVGTTKPLAESPKRLSLFRPQRRIGEETVTLFHGSSIKSAESILKEGFKGQQIFLSPNREFAKQFGDVVLAVTTAKGKLPLEGINVVVASPKDVLAVSGLGKTFQKINTLQPQKTFLRAVGPKRPEVFRAETVKKVTVPKKERPPGFRQGLDTLPTDTFTTRKVDPFAFDVRLGSRLSSKGGEIDPFTDLTKFQAGRRTLLDRIIGRGEPAKKPSTPFKFSVSDKPMTGRAAALTRTELKQTQERLIPKQKGATKERQDPFGGFPVFDGSGGGGGVAEIQEVSRSILEPKSITQRRPAEKFLDEILERRTTGRRTSSQGGINIIDPLGTVSERDRKRDRLTPFERQVVNPLAGLSLGGRISSDVAAITKITPRQDRITGRATIQEQFPISITDLVPGERQTTRTRTPQITTTKTPTRTTTITGFPPRTPTTTTTKPPSLTFGFPPLVFPGGGGFDGKKSGKGRKKFSIFSVNPDVIGVLEQEGAPGLLTSDSPDIFDIGEGRIRRARKRQESISLGSGIMLGTERRTGRAINRDSIRMGRSLGRTIPKGRQSKPRSKGTPKRTPKRSGGMNLGRGFKL